MLFDSILLEPPVRLPIPQITIFVLVLHMVLGCCWHHAHIDAAPCCPVAGVTGAPCGHHDHGHDGHHHQHAAHDGDAAPTSDHPQRHDNPCPEGRCVFARLTESWQPDLESVEKTIAAIATEAFVDGFDHLAVRSIDGGPHRWRCDTAPPLRPHLVLQVLLI